MSKCDYVLGTQEDEVERLGLQHRVWRRHVLDGWTTAGIAPGMTVIDVGAGPGFAATDLAEIVGPDGRVIALERSPNFLQSLQDRAGRLGLANIEARSHDVSEAGFGADIADASWCRWLLSFVTDPAATVRHIAEALKPGGVAVFHEYADYGAWRTMPPNPDVERFRDLAIRSWRDSGGEPDIALRLPGMLKAAEWRSSPLARSWRSSGRATSPGAGRPRSWPSTPPGSASSAMPMPTRRRASPRPSTIARTTP